MMLTDGILLLLLLFLGNCGRREEDDRYETTAGRRSRTIKFNEYEDASAATWMLY